LSCHVRVLGGLDLKFENGVLVNVLGLRKLLLFLLQFGFFELEQKIFERGDIPNISLTPDNELDIM